LPSDDIGKFLNMLNDNIPYSQNVIDRMLLYYKNNFFTQINNNNNFNHFSVLLNTILFNIDRKNEYLDINFAIIYIAEKTFYKNKNNSYNKIYLCSLLSKNKIYSEKSFWRDLIDLKHKSVVDNKLPSEIKKKENELIAQQNKLKQQMQENQKKEEEENSISINSSLTNDNINTLFSSESSAPSSSPVTLRKASLGTGSLMNMFGNKVKNFFLNSNSVNNNSESSKSLSYNSLDTENKKHLKSEPLLQVNKEQVLECLRKTESANILREFLTHFCNFNFDVSEANDLIVENSIKYNYEPEKVNFYISMLNSNMFTIKNKFTKVSFVDFKTSGIEKNFKKYINLNDNKLIILASCLKYTNLTDYPNLLTINKNYNKKISKIIFSNILLNYQDSKLNNGLHKHENQKKVRLGLWRKALNIVKYSKK